MVKCATCGRPLTGRHVVGTEGFTYCNDACADDGWHEKGADLWAQGEPDYDPRWMTGIDDLMEERGIANATYHRCEKMSDYA